MVFGSFVLQGGNDARGAVVPLILAPPPVAIVSRLGLVGSTIGHAELAVWFGVGVGDGERVEGRDNER